MRENAAHISTGIFGTIDAAGRGSGLETHPREADGRRWQGEGPRPHGRPRPGSILSSSMARLPAELPTDGKREERRAGGPMAQASRRAARSERIPALRQAGMHGFFVPRPAGDRFFRRRRGPDCGQIHMNGAVSAEPGASLELPSMKRVGGPSLRRVMM